MPYTKAIDPYYKKEESTTCRRGCMPEMPCEWLDAGKVCCRDVKPTIKSITDVANFKGVSVAQVKKEVRQVEKTIKMYGEFHLAVDSVQRETAVHFPIRTGVTNKGLLNLLSPHVRMYYEGKPLDLLPRLFLLPEDKKTWLLLGVTKDTYLAFKDKLTNHTD